MLRSVYVLAKHDFSLRSHTTLVELQKLNGINLGNRHNSAKGAGSMVHFISEMIHEETLTTLTKEKNPV